MLLWTCRISEDRPKITTHNEAQESELHKDTLFSSSIKCSFHLATWNEDMTLWWWVLLDELWVLFCLITPSLKNPPMYSHENLTFPNLKGKKDFYCCVVFWAWACHCQWDLCVASPQEASPSHVECTIFSMHSIVSSPSLRVLQLEPSSLACLLLNYSFPHFPFWWFEFLGQGKTWVEPDGMQIVTIGGLRILIS